MPISKRRKKAKRAKKRKHGNPRRVEELRQALDYTIPVVGEAFVAARAIVPGPAQVLAESLPQKPAQGTRLDPISAGIYLNGVRESLETRALEIAEVYPAVQWLWYTRRITPEFFAGRLLTSKFADHNLLEALSGLSKSVVENRLEIEGRSIYPSETKDLVPVAELASIAVALSQCHSWLRRAGKGTAFIVAKPGLPDPLPDEQLEQAIDVFDKRVADDLQWQWHPSIELNDAQAEGEEDPPAVLITLSRLLGTWSDVPGWQGPLRDRRIMRVLGQFSINLATLRGLADSVAAAATSSAVWWRPHTPSLVTLLFTLWYDATFLSTSLGLSLPKVGYLRRRRDYAEKAIDAMMPLVRDELETYFPGQVPKSGEAVLQTLESLGPDLWPIEIGPVVRTLGDDVVLDVWAASSRLVDAIRIPAQAGGALVNAPARRFEEVVQAGVDRTPWGPSGEARALRRTLRLNGRPLTDIDAVAERDGTLLLISCKNIPLTRAYDAGDYNTVRNAASTVDKAYDFWQSVVGTLDDSPVGDNYDVSMFCEIRGVVVTPTVLYTGSVVTLVEHDIGRMRLRGAVSLGELVKSLNESQ